MEKLGVRAPDLIDLRIIVKLAKRAKVKKKNPSDFLILYISLWLARPGYSYQGYRQC